MKLVGLTAYGIEIRNEEHNNLNCIIFMECLYWIIFTA